MLRLKRAWTGRMRMLAVLGLLALIGVSCAGGVREEELAELQGRLADIESKVDAAQQTADEALAQSAQPAGTAPAGERVALAGGIALTYEHGGEAGLVTYPVNSTYVYDFYGEFAGAWKDRPGTIVELAWIGGDEEGTWQLHFFDRKLVRGDSGIALSDVTLTQWHEYLVYTRVGSPTGTDPVSSPVLVDRGRQQSIVEGIAFKEEEMTAEGIPSITGLGETQNGRRFVQFLLSDESSGENTLVTVLQPLCELPKANCPLQAPDSSDSPGQQYCTNCVWGLCILGCWW